MKARLSPQRGLLGIFNGDVSDDFTAPDGSKISINSSQQEIYEKFGIHCKYLTEVSFLPGGGLPKLGDQVLFLRSKGGSKDFFN